METDDFLEIEGSIDKLMETMVNKTLSARESAKKEY